MKRRKTRKGKKRNKLIIFSFIGLTLLLTVGYAAFSTNITLNVKGNVKDKSRVIKAWTNASNEDFHTDFYRERIRTITFLDTAKVPSEVPSNQKWDVSEAGDNGVTAYVVESIEENDTYDLYIGAKHGVIGNRNSSSLFYNFKNVKSINFNNNYDTSNATTMYSMFRNCNSLTQLDVSDFDTSKVATMQAMFMNCIELTDLDLSNFDTSNVTNMGQMFRGGDPNHKMKIKKIDLSNFNTKKVKNMTQMFDNCGYIEILDLSSFDTSNVTNIIYMFDNCSNLKTIYTSENFVTTGISDITTMFSNDLNLVGGNGTTFDSAHTDSEYARIDTNEAPGYFTLKTE